MIPYEEECDERLALLKLKELNMHLDILCLKYIAKVRDYDDHLCKKFLKDQDHRSINRSSFMDSNLFHKIHLIALLCCFLFNYLLCMVLFVIELTWISINMIYIFKLLGLYSTVLRF